MRSKQSVNLTLRKLVPSVSKLTYNPLLALLLNSFDLFPGRLFREFRNLPPNAMRARVGVGNRLFANQVMYLLRGYPMWMHALARGFVTFESDIVEIGCGVGRRAHIIRDYNFHGLRYTGKYMGIDIDKEMLDWCRNHFDDRFEFVQSSHHSESYKNVGGLTQGLFEIPCKSNSVDFVFSTSLLTHLLEPEARNYFNESARILRSGSRMMMSCFAIDYSPKLIGDRYTFSHRKGPAYIESTKVPEAAVAYESAWLIAAAKESGFRSAEILHDSGDVQHMLVAQV